MRALIIEEDRLLSAQLKQCLEGELFKADVAAT